MRGCAKLISIRGKEARRRFLLCVTFLVLALPGIAWGADGPGLGRPMSADEVEFWNRSVAPDGRGLPDGRGTVRAGARVYAARCAACHGPEGAGDPADRLVGGIGTLASADPVRTLGSFWPHATTLFDYIRRAMPYDAPKSLADGEVYAVTAYLLYLNGIIAEDAALDRASLPAVRMPNRDGFIWAEDEPGLEGIGPPR